MTATSYDRVTAALEGVVGSRPANERLNWRCPAHDDGQASLTVTRSDNGTLLHCHAGCSTDDVLAAVGLSKADLFDAPQKTNGRSSRPEIIATYDYTDEDGRLLFQTVRMLPKDFRQRRPSDGGGWIWSLADTRRVLYRLPRIIEAVQRGLTVYVVEGEKDVGALEAVGHVGTCNPMGAGKWRDEYAQVLGGADVVVVVDRDETGRRHARQVAASLDGVAASVRIVQAAEGKDIADHLAAGHSLDELVPVIEVGDTAEQASTEPDEEPEPPKTLSFSWVDEVALEPPPEPPALVEGLIRKGDLVVVGAARGVGKSWMAYNLSTLLARGEGLFLGALPVVCSAPVLIAQGELDPWGAWARWRRLCGEDLPASVGETFERWRLRVTTQRSSQSGRDGSGAWSEQHESIDARLDPRVEATLVAEGFEVLLIDPWRTFYSGRENDNDQVEAALDKLRDLSLRLGTTVVIFAHLGKSTEGRDPEDLWRGASRLADWASVRVTLLPHYTDSQREKQGMTRQQARRYVDAKFLLRNGAAPDDFSLAWNPENGWWDRWVSPQDVAAGRRAQMLGSEVAKLLEESGGEWVSEREAAEAMGLSRFLAQRALADAAREGWIVSAPGAGKAWCYRLPEPDEVI